MGNIIDELYEETQGIHIVQTNEALIGPFDSYVEAVEWTIRKGVEVYDIIPLHDPYTGV